MIILANNSSVWEKEATAGIAVGKVPVKTETECNEVCYQNLVFKMGGILSWFSNEKVQFRKGKKPQ